jgi:cell division protein FtsA
MRNLLTGLDVGTSKVCAIVGEALPDGQLATLGFGVAPCTGLRKGVVVNIEATVDAIRSAVEEAAKTSGVRVGSAVVGVAGPHIKGLNSHGIVAVRGGEVSSRDVDRVIDAARAVAIPLDRQVLHILPQQFAVDEQEGVREPYGMAGVRLEARIHIVTAAQSYGQNLTKCCERAGVTPS